MRVSPTDEYHDAYPPGRLRQCVQHDGNASQDQPEFVLPNANKDHAAVVVLTKFRPGSCQAREVAGVEREHDPTLRRAKFEESLVGPTIERTFFIG